MERASVRIVGAGAAGFLLGGLLGCAGHPVAFSGDPQERRLLARAGLRLILPSGWQVYRPPQPEAPRARADLVLVALPRHELRRRAREHKGRLLEALGIREGERPVFLDEDPEELEKTAPGKEAPGGGRPAVLLGLLEAFRPQLTDVELYTGRPVLLWQKGAFAEGTFSALKPFGFELAEAEEIACCAHALFLQRLLDLPAALCGTTRGHFLSFREGREIARRVLEEGLTVLTRCRKRPARLPRDDPQELLRRLRKAARDDEAGRCRPDRAFAGLLQAEPQKAALRLDADEARELNGRLVRMGSQAGVDARWNWGLLRKLERAARQGTFPDPVRLLEALR